MRKPHLVSERIDAKGSAFDIAAMGRGEPAPPQVFTWRGQRFAVARILSATKQMGEDRGDRYVRRHYYDIETADALRMRLYFERNPSDHSKPKAWWLYTVTMPEPTIETQRLLLRRWTYADRDAFAHMVADPDVMRHLHALEPMTQTEADESLEATIRRYELGYGDWAIELRESGDIIGESGLTPVDRGGDEQTGGSNDVEIGWMLLRPHWGHGYAFEAANAVKEYSFTTLGIGRLLAFVRPGNDRSSRVAEKLGMHRVGAVTNRRGHEMLKYEVIKPAS